MKLSFTGHTKSERTIDFDPADRASVEALALAYFLQRIEYTDLKNAYSDEDRLVVRLCEKYGVDPHYAPDRLALFKKVVEQS